MTEISANIVFLANRLILMFTIIKDKKLVAILALALLLRLVFFFIYQPWDAEVEKTLVLNGDAVQYHYLGIAILKTFGFADNVFRTPVYPAFIALIYAVFGIHPYIVLLFQIFLSVVSIYVVFKIVELSFNRKVGLVAGFIMALDPSDYVCQLAVFRYLLCVFVYSYGLLFYQRNVAQRFQKYFNKCGNSRYKYSDKTGGAVFPGGINFIMLNMDKTGFENKIKIQCRLFIDSVFYCPSLAAQKSNQISAFCHFFHCWF